jgi:hypothetical protein
LAAALLLGPRPGQAIAPLGDTRKDAKRFGKQLSPSSRLARPQGEQARRAFSEFNRRNGGRWKIRLDPRTGAAEALIEGEAFPQKLGPAASGGGAAPQPAQAAAAFLGEQAALLGIDPAALVLEKQSDGDGHAHVLYRQTYRGLPVEFSRLKVHLADSGTVIGANARYERNLSLDINPALSASQAADVVLGDCGIAPSGEGTLVVFPSQQDDKPRLAWKLTARGKTALWRYYIDAVTGKLLFRYNDLRMQACATSGTVQGMVYDIDPSTTPVLAARPFRNQRVYVKDGANSALTGGGGAFCSTMTGKIVTSLQGPYVNVASFIGPSAHYDNGSGVWSTLSTPLSSPHPYPNSSLLTSTIDISAVLPAAVKILPVFSSFQVGLVDDGLDITDDDQLEILGPDERSVASYVGNRGPFNGAAVHGGRLRLRLRSNSAGQQNGYDIAVSSYLVLSSPGTLGASSNLTWTGAYAASGRRGEISLFYHLNEMHDYFMGDVNKSSAAYIGNSVVASAYMGPNIRGAFYNPEFDNLSFGDIEASNPREIVTDDATVARHEYTHYVVEKIWPIQNFGQAGAISEAIADYFAASSLNYSFIASYFNAPPLGSGGPLRQLDCQTYGPCKKLNVTNPWAGEIHDDSIFLSQALWDVRRDRIATLGSAAGRSCADGLVFQSLLFFPESFNEFLDAMRRVESAALVGACGAPSAPAQTAINNAFSAHGLSASANDAFEGSRRNDGFETAVDIATHPALSATISPAGDLDFYSFAAGPGPIQITLRLPADGPFYKGYAMTLYDRQHRVVAEGQPPFDGFDTFSGLCESSNCTTTAPSAVLTYNNPSPGLFFLQVAGGPTADGASNSGVNSAVPYVLEPAYPVTASLSVGVVSAVFDQDLIDFSVNVTTFLRTQNYNFAHARLRDHALGVLPNTDTGDLGGFLTMVSSTNALGRITGRLQLGRGFADRFPAVGTVHLEVFGYNVDPDNVRVSTISLGLSQALNLTADKAELKAYNNVFNPLSGGKATIKYQILAPGRLTLKLYTINGTLVATLFDGEAPAGKGSVDWAGRNVSGTVVASGVYVLQLEAPGISKRQKIVVVK